MLKNVRMFEGEMNCFSKMVKETKLAQVPIEKERIAFEQEKNAKNVRRY